MKVYYISFINCVQILLKECNNIEVNVAYFREA
jgi:hypothetical protein